MKAAFFLWVLVALAPRQEVRAGSAEATGDASRVASLLAMETNSMTRPDSPGTAATAQSAANGALPAQALLRLGLPLLHAEQDGSFSLKEEGVEAEQPSAIRFGTEYLRQLLSLRPGHRSGAAPMLDVSVRVEPETTTGDPLTGVELSLPARSLSIRHEEEDEEERTTSVQWKLPW